MRLAHDVEVMEQNRARALPAKLAEAAGMLCGPAQGYGAEVVALRGAVDRSGEEADRPQARSA